MRDPKIIERTSPLSDGGLDPQNGRASLVYKPRTLLLFKNIKSNLALGFVGHWTFGHLCQNS